MVHIKRTGLVLDTLHGDTTLIYELLHEFIHKCSKLGLCVSVRKAKKLAYIKAVATLQ